MYGFSDVSRKAHSLKELATKVDDIKQLQEAARELVEWCRKAAEAGKKERAEPRAEQVESQSQYPSSAQGQDETGQDT